MGITANTEHFLSDWNLGHLTALRFLTTTLSGKTIFQLGLASGIGVWLSSHHQKAFQPGLDTGWNGGGIGGAEEAEERAHSWKRTHRSHVPAGQLPGSQRASALLMETSRPSFPGEWSGERLGDLEQLWGDNGVQYDPWQHWWDETVTCPQQYNVSAADPPPDHRHNHTRVRTHTPRRAPPVVAVGELHVHTVAAQEGLAVQWDVHVGWVLDRLTHDDEAG